MFDEKILEKIPRSPGVYMMKNTEGKIIYTGKARNLKARISQYFTGTDERPSIPFLMKQSDTLDWIVTNTEKEALILENTLIKKHHPRFNILLTDDKTYLSLRINLKEDFPRVEVVRIRRKPADGAVYFGPYSSAQAIRHTLRYVQKYFPLRTCSSTKFCRQRGRPCLDYEIGRCSGPCHGLISKDDYRKILDNVILFLRGRNTELIENFEKKMKIEAEELRFEDAQRTRDAIMAIRESMERQQVYSTRWSNQDVYGLYREGDELEIAVMHIRDGKLQDTTARAFRNVILDDDEVIGDFIGQMYEENRYIPSEIIIPVELADAKTREEILSERKGSAVNISTPRRGGKLGLLDMAKRNAESAFILKHDRDRMNLRALEELKIKLRLRSIPRRIECFDISTIQGRFAVGSMAVFTDGIPDRKEYRKYRIRSLKTPDDYGMMREIMERRIRRGIDENNLPDLIVMDGGKGQLNIASVVLKDLSAPNIGLISISKDKSDWREDKSEEEKIYVRNVKDPVRFRRNSPGMFLIQQIRDEAHRFAITYHKTLRKKSGLRSVLDDIPGIGIKRRKALLNAFGSLKKIREATIDELASVKGMSRAVAEKIKGQIQNALSGENNNAKK